MFRKQYPKQGLIAMAFLFASALQAQSLSPSVVANAGGEGSSATHQVAWTIGEPIITTEMNATNQLTQGFHQTQLVVSSIAKVELSFSIEVFPNPTTSTLTLSLENDRSEDVQWSLVDVMGREQKTGMIQSAVSNYQLNVQDLENGIYFLNLKTSENQTIQTHKIQKR